MEKGVYGYVSRIKKRKLLHTVILFSITSLIIISGYFISGRTKNNLFTVIGIVSVLPAAKALTGLIVIWPYKTFDKALYEKIKGVDESGMGLYDIVMSSNERIMNIYAVIPCTNRICVLLPSKEKEPRYIEQYLFKIFKGKLETRPVKTFTDEKIFSKSLDFKDFKSSDELETALNELKYYMIGD